MSDERGSSRLVHVSSSPATLSARIRWIGWAVAVLALYWWSAEGTRLNVYSLLEGLHGVGDIFVRMFPPRLDVLPKLVDPAVETVQISIWGTTLGVLFSIPLGILAAKNVTPNRLTYVFGRQILNLLRAIPEMVMALIFVASVGLGPFPGVLAVAFHSTGMLGKFLADSIENVDPGPMEALVSTGARSRQIFAYAVVPQILPEFVSLCLFRWEMNFRSSTVLGIVGAGGLGFELITSMRLFRYQEMTTIILLILAFVALVDFLASRIRKRII